MAASSFKQFRDERNQINVLMVDDHQMLIDGIKQILGETDHINCVAEANNGEEALTLLKVTQVDVVLLDMQMPRLNGIETAKLIRKRHPSIKILALSMNENQRHIQQMLKLGAKGYLLKNTGRENLIKAIERANKGEITIDPKISQQIILGLTNGPETEFIPQLTRREKEVLELIAQEKTTQEIAASLFITQNAVEYHRKNLFVKFEARNVVGLIRKVIEKGILE